MSATSTAVNACDAGVWLDDDAGVPKNISGSSNQVTLDFSNEIGEYRAFGDKWPRRLECGKDARFRLRLIYSTASDEAVDILKTWFFADTPGNRTLTVYVPDKNVGSDRYQGEVKIDTWTGSLDRGDAGPIMVDLNLLPDGAVTHSVAAT